MIVCFLEYVVGIVHFISSLYYIIAHCNKTSIGKIGLSIATSELC